MRTLRVIVSAWCLVLLGAGAGAAFEQDQRHAAFDTEKALAGWQLSGAATWDGARTRAATPGGGSLKLGPGGKAVWKLREQDGAATLDLWVYDDLTVPADPKQRRVGPRWGLLQADGRVLVVGMLYAPYLSGQSSFATSDSDQRTTWFNVQFLGSPRKEGWRRWTFTLDADKGLAVACDGKDVNAARPRFDWNKTALRGAVGVALFGDDGNDARAQTIWVDDVTVTLGGPMKAAPTPPPPPAPITPEKDPAVGNPLPLQPAAAGKHPRLLFTADDLPRLRAFAQKEGKPCFDRLLAYLPSCTPPEDAKFLRDATDAQRQGLWRLPTVALHWVLTRDPKSLERATGFLRKFVALEHWEEGDERDSGMGAANILAGAALAYDWLHADLDPAFREAVRRKLLLQARRQYYGGHLMKNPGTHYWQNDPQNNHRWHRDAGLVLAALAVAGDGPDAVAQREADWVVARAAEELAFVAKWLPPDGTCHESPSYMAFGMPYLTLACDAADRCLGTKWLDHPCFKAAPGFRLQTLCPGLKQVFCYGDAGGTGFINDYAFRATARHRLADAQAGLLQFRATDPDAFTYGWFGLLWSDPTLTGGDLARLPRRAVYPDLGLVFARDGWDARNVGAMFKCGPYGGHLLNAYRNADNYRYINVAHDDPDANLFVIYAQGALLADDDRYAKKKLTAAHNTLLVNGKGQKGEGAGWTQPLKNTDMSKLARLVTWKDTDAVSLAEGEAGGMYAGLSRFRRTFIWAPGSYILVCDDVRAPKDAEFTWLVQGPAAEAVSPPEGRYRLKKDAAMLEFALASDRPLTGKIAASPAEHQGKPLGYQQVQVSAQGAAWRVAAVFDAWGKGNLKVTLEPSGPDAATLRVTGPGFADTWQWQAAPDAVTPATWKGSREGGFRVEVGAGDKAPQP